MSARQHDKFTIRAFFLYSSKPDARSAILFLIDHYYVDGGAMTDSVSVYETHPSIESCRSRARVLKEETEAELGMAAAEYKEIYESEAPLDSPITKLYFQMYVNHVSADSYYCNLYKAYGHENGMFSVDVRVYYAGHRTEEGAKEAATMAMKHLSKNMEFECNYIFTKQF